MKPTGPGQSTHLLLEVVALLDDSAVEYAVIGALAAAVHGAVRASLDADAVVQVTIAQLSELQANLANRGLTTELRRGDAADPIPALLQIADVFGNRVDLLAGLRGLDSGIYSRAISIPFEGSRLRVAGTEDFIAMKVFAGGPLDLVDARRAMAVSRKSLDVELLLRLATRFGNHALQNCRQLLDNGQAAK
jgi:predicted nucleotidyltransferase